MKLTSASARCLPGAVGGLALGACAGCNAVAGPSVIDDAAAPAQFTRPAARRSPSSSSSNSAFPYHGTFPPDERHERASRSSTPTTTAGSAINRRAAGLFGDTTYNDRRVLFAASPNFDPNGAGRHRVFFHGNQATLSRDVVERQQAARQLAASEAQRRAGRAAARGRRAGFERRQFLAPGAFAQFLDEAESKLARSLPQRRAQRFRAHAGRSSSPTAAATCRRPFARAWRRGRARRGVVLLDALYRRSRQVRAIGSRGARPARSSSAPIRLRPMSENEALRDRLERDGVAVEDGVPGDAKARRRRLRRFRRRRATTTSSTPPGPAIR